MESNAGGMVRRLALKTRFSEMGWGSTPLLSAKHRTVISAVEYHIDIVKVTGSIPVQSTKQDFLGVAML